MNRTVKKATIILLIVLSFFLSIRGECAQITQRNDIDIVTGMPKAAQEKLKIILGH